MGVSVPFSHSVMGMFSVQVSRSHTDFVPLLCRFQFASCFIAYLFWAPLETIIITGLIWREVGASSLLVLALLLCVMIPVTFVFAKRFARLRYVEWERENVCCVAWCCVLCLVCRTYVY
jgi:hypothetical protein